MAFVIAGPILVTRRRRPKEEPVPAGRLQVLCEHLLHSLKGHGATVTQAMFVGNDKLLATAAYDQTINVYDVSTGDCLYTLPVGCKGARFHQTMDGTHLVTTAKNNTIGVWSLAGGACISLLQAEAQGVVPLQGGNNYDARAATVSPGGGMICSAHGGVITVWETRNSCRLKQLNTQCNLRIRDLVISACGQMMAIGGEELLNGGPREGGSVRPLVAVWWMATNKHVSINVDPDGAKAKLKSVAIKCIDISEGGKFVAVASGSPLDHYASVWNVETKCEAAALKHNGPVWCLRLVPKCGWLVTGCALKSDRIRIWDWRNEVCLGQLGSGTGGITCLALNKDCTMMAAGHQHGSAKVWDLSMFKDELYRTKWALIQCRALKLSGRSKPHQPKNVMHWKGKTPADRALEWLLNVDQDPVFRHICQFVR